MTGTQNPSRATDPCDLNRFAEAQDKIYDQALAEIRNGRKESHWIWFVFPQIQGLGSSPTAKYYAIKSAEEAHAYLNHPVLGPRLSECAEEVLAVENRSAHEIFGSPDDLKLKSSATLFAHVSEKGSVFERLLDKHYQGEADTKTLDLLDTTQRRQHDAPPPPARERDTAEAALLTTLPCLDTDEMAAVARQQLDVPRHIAKNLGQSAVKAIREGGYINPDGHAVVWRRAVTAACDAKRSIAPEDTLPASGRDTFRETRIQVSNETTLVASRRLSELGHRPLALNFANGVQPGGGFLSGSRAQEEVLCRSSALYQTLLDDAMYQKHSRGWDRVSSDWAILSPDVPVFRQDDGTALNEPWLLSFITCAAPVARAIGQDLSGALLEKRIHRVLAIARAYGYSTLVLGAWGCGAFGNDPLRTAMSFRQALEGEFSGAFSDIAFAITDWSPERTYLGPFRAVFS